VVGDGRNQLVGQLRPSGPQKPNGPGVVLAKLAGSMREWNGLHGPNDMWPGYWVGGFRALCFHMGEATSVELPLARGPVGLIWEKEKEKEKERKGRWAWPNLGKE
jgi:hypothetical protein